MKRFLFIILAGLTLVAAPVATMAADLQYQGVVGSAMTRVTTTTDGATQRRTIVQHNDGRQTNVSFTFDNVSGIMSNGRITFPAPGAWFKFGGAALAPTTSKFSGTLACEGIIKLDGDVTFDPATGLYSGSGNVVEFSGSMNVTGMLSRGGHMRGGSGGGGMTGGGSGGPGMMGRGGVPGGGGPGGGGGSSTGMMKAWITPTLVNVVPVTAGVPDRSAPATAGLAISLPAIQLQLVTAP